MPAFLYFVPDHTTPVTLEHLRQWGLDYAFASIPYHAVVQGPTGQQGTLLVDDVALDPYVPQYRDEDQVWRLQPGREFWVGHYRSALPSVIDLAREEMLPGDRVQLADGHWWQVPQVRQAAGDGTTVNALPAYLDLDAKGNVIRGEPVDQYRWLMDRATPYWEAWYAACTAALARLQSLPPEATPEDREAASRFLVECDTLLADAVAILSANYRIGLVEAMALRLWRTDDGPAGVLNAACDTLTASWYLQKKTLLAG